MNQRFVHTTFRIIYFLMAMALLINTMQPMLALAAPHQALQTRSTSTNAATTDMPGIVPATPTNVCNLFPIALHTSSIAGVKPGDNIGDIFNGASPGNFGWLSWTGDPSEPTLVTKCFQVISAEM